MSRRPSGLGGNVLWLLLSTFGYAGAQYALVIVLARWGGAEPTGQFALALAVTAPPILLANCALRTVQATDSSASFQFGDYLGFRTLTLVLAFAAIVVFAGWFGPEMAAPIVVTGIAKVFESLGDLVHGAMQRQERMDLIAKSQLIKGIGSLLAGSVIFICTESVALMTGAIAIVYALAWLAYDLPAGASLEWGESGERARCWLRPRWNSVRFVEISRLAFPMGVTVIVGALIANMPRYFLSHYQGEAELGVFAAIAWFAQFGNLVASAAAHAVLPRLPRVYAASDRDYFRRLCWALIVGGAFVGGIVACLGILLAPVILSTIYGPVFAGQSDAFRVLLVAMALSIEICILDHVLYAARRFRAQVPLNGVALIAMLVICWFLIPQSGVLGAAWATCVVFSLQFVMRLGIARRILADLAEASVAKNIARSLSS